MRISLSIFLLGMGGAGLQAANPPVISNVAISSITRSGVRVTWNTDVAATQRLDYGLTAAYGTSQDISYQRYASHAVYLSGLSAGTLYHVRACSIDSSESCAQDLTFTTLPAITQGAEPAVPPADVDTSLPAVTGTSYQVAADCSDLQTQIYSAAAADGNMTHEVVIPSGTTCYGQYSLPVKTGQNPAGPGWLLLRSSNIGSSALPPEGARITLADASNTATIGVNRIKTWLYPYQPPGDCSLGGFWWDDDEHVFSLSQCTQSSPPVYTPIQPVGSGVNLPATCDTGDWFYKTDVPGHNNRAHWCVSQNTWRQITLIAGGNFTEWAAIKVEDGAKRWRVMGLTLKSMAIPSTYVTQLLQTQYTGGSITGCLASANSTADDRIVFDRVIFDGLGYPNRTIYALCFFEGSNMSVINSTFNEINWHVPASSGLETSVNAIFFSRGPGPYKIENNYFKNNIGLTIFASDDSGTYSNTAPDNVTVRRNYFYEDPAYNHNDPQSNGHYYWRRNILELKRGKRWLLEGNVFDGGWPTSTSGGCISFTPRPGGGGNLLNTLAIADITIRGNWIKNCPDAVGMVGWNDYFDGQLQQTQRILIENNLITETGKSSTGITSGWPYNRTMRGTAFFTVFGMQDQIIRRNTIYGSVGSYQDPYFSQTLYDSTPSTGLSATDNIFYAENGYDSLFSGNSGLGVAGLNGVWKQGSIPAWEVRGNVMVKNGGTNPANQPAGNIYAASVSALGLDGEYRLPRSSNYRGSGTGGVTPGIDGPAYDSLRGIASRFRLLGRGPASLLVGYLAPDGDVCHATAGTSMAADGGGARDRQLAIDGLAPGSAYTVTLYCGTSRLIISASTTTPNSQNATVQLALTAPTGRGVEEAVVDYGPSSNLGFSTAPIACATTCTTNVAATRGEPLYYRVRYRRDPSANAAVGRIEKLVP